MEGEPVTLIDSALIGSKRFIRRIKSSIFWLKDKIYRPSSDENLLPELGFLKETFPKKGDQELSSRSAFRSAQLSMHFKSIHGILSAGVRCERSFREREKESSGEQSSLVSFWVLKGESESVRTQRRRVGEGPKEDKQVQQYRIVCLWPTVVPRY